MARTPKIVGDRREQIINAAMHVFAHKGFSRATNKDIAHEAGITPGLIYHYFESKEAVLLAIFEDRSPIRVVRSLPEDALTQSPEVFLRFFLSQVLPVVEDESFVQLIRVFLPEVLHNPAIVPLGSQIFQQVLTVFEKFFLAKMSNGEIRTVDAALVAQSFVSNLIGFVFRRQVLRDPLVMHYSHEQIIDTVLSITLNGLLPR